MAEPLPPPLVPAGTNLRDFAYMPLDVVRLRDSDLVAEVSPEAFRCAVLLWCVSWHQVPAGSLPDDDVLLCGYAGFGRVLREWKRHRDGALHGWIKCSDGRLYHPVVAEKAVEAQASRYNHTYKTECARIKKNAQRAGTVPDYPTFEVWLNHFISTGSAKWVRTEERPSGLNCPDIVPGTSGECPEMSRSKGREGKGREGNSSSTTNAEARLGNPERAESVAGALRKFGYSVSSTSIEVDRLVAITATDGEIAEACAKAVGCGFLPPKPLAWVVSRIEGRRADLAAKQPASSAQAQQPADPVPPARRNADHILDAKLIDARHMRAIGLYTDADHDAAVERARAEHAATLAQLGAAA